MNQMKYYKIASFNIKQLSNNSVFHGGKSDSKKDLDVIANIVTDNDIDIIAVQEIRGKLAFRELISAIAYGYTKDITADVLEQPGADGERKLITENQGDDYIACKAGKWEGRWAHPNSKHVTAIGEEGYAFIWNTEKFELPERESGRRVQPVIKHKSEYYFVRPPFYGRFVTKNIGPKFEIAILNTHVLYTKNKEIKRLKDNNIDMDALSDLNLENRETFKELKEKYGLLPSEMAAYKVMLNQTDVERRRSEVRNLVTEVLEREENKSGRYVFLIGDYNLNLKDSAPIYKNKSATIGSEIIYAAGKPYSSTYVIKQVQLSTLKTPPNEDKDPNGDYEQLSGINRFANNYDHVTYNKNLITDRGIEIRDPITLNVLDNSKYGLTNREYFERISDHLPIIMEVGF